MAVSARSLRDLVQHWLLADPHGCFRVSHVGRWGKARYVRVVADNAANSIAMFFFRHRDGRWCIFPPDPERPAMSIDRGVAAHAQEAG
ncbi:hypothetical protein F6X42_40245 [Paraburkholderia sp. WC7.3b]|uniref:Uncharacterized protein n=1 Tax=Paraburkholderia podalyriae TaxID=1938811 RepID=A0ABR7Q1Q1_9BURK|nr:hypothetical protein [Paraburkholderia podalyriae]